MRRDAERELLPAARRITGIVCQMRHIRRERWSKAAHRVSESDDLEIIGSCNVGVRTDRNPNHYLFGRLALTRRLGAKSR
jgi:hypothetical protein